MTYQVTINDFRDAIKNMTSNVASVTCSEKPTMKASISFFCRDDGTIYTVMDYVVGNEKMTYESNIPIKVLLADFNKAMYNFDANKNGND